jgi:hypothetical protein
MVIIIIYIFAKILFRKEQKNRTQQASNVWRQHLLSKADRNASSPTNGEPQIPSPPLLRQRCQSLYKLRACHPEHQHTPYAGRA